MIQIFKIGIVNFSYLTNRILNDPVDHGAPHLRTYEKLLEKELHQNANSQKMFLILGGLKINNVLLATYINISVGT